MFRHGTIAVIIGVLTVVTTAKGVAGAAKKGTGAVGIGAAEEAGTKAAVPNPKGGAGPVAKGQVGVAKSRAAAEARGDTIIGEEVTFDAGGVRTRVDLLVETKNGQMIAIDAKRSRTSRWSYQSSGG